MNVLANDHHRVRASVDRNGIVHLDQLGSLRVEAIAGDSLEINRATCPFGIEVIKISHSKVATRIIENRRFGQDAIESEIIDAIQ